MMWICKGSEMLLYERLFYCGLSASLGCQFISASLSVLLCTLVLIRTSDSLMDTFSSCGISHSSVGSLSLDLSTSTSGRIDILSKHKGPVRGKGLGLELRSHDSSEVCFLLLWVCCDSASCFWQPFYVFDTLSAIQPAAAYRFDAASIFQRLQCHGKVLALRCRETYVVGWQHSDCRVRARKQLPSAKY